MQCVILQPKGTTRNANLPTSLTTLPSPADVGKVLRRSMDPDYIGFWKQHQTRIHLFAYKTGKVGTENKHELPEPYDSLTLFGEAVILATSNTEDQILQTFNTNLYTKFYNEITADKDSDSESDGDSDGDELPSDLEEEEEEQVSESESDSEPELEIEEEEEEIPVPVKVLKPKRTNKKIPVWFVLSDMTEENVDDLIPIFRQNCLSRCKVYLTALSKEQHEELEKGIFRYSLEDAKKKHLKAVWENPEFQTLYDVHVRRVLSNLDERSYVKNTRLIQRLQEGEFKVWEIPYMSCADLYPENWVTLSEREMKREAKMLEVDTSMATDMFRCSRCGKRQCTYYEQQTRSADEPMTIFIRCINCGKQWRQ